MWKSFILLPIFFSSFCLLWELPILKLADFPLSPFATYAETNIGLIHSLAGNSGYLYYFRKERGQNHTLTNLSIEGLFFEDAGFMNDLEDLYIVAFGLIKGLRAVYVSQSMNKGSSWLPFRRVTSGSGNLPPGRINTLTLASGRLFIIYVNSKNNTISYITKPKGSQTWSPEHVIYADPSSNLQLIDTLVVGEKLMCYFFKAGTVYYIFSEDVALTWSEPEPLLEENARDYHVVYAGNKLFMIYETPFYERQISVMRFSEDEGETWSAKQLISTFYSHTNGSVGVYKAYKRTTGLAFWPIPAIKRIDTVDMKLSEMKTPFPNIKAMKVAFETNSTGFAVDFHCYAQMNDNLLYYSSDRVFP